MKIKEALRINMVPVLFASLCCLAPIVLVLLGLSSVAFAASLTHLLDGQYGWLFDLVGLFLLVFSLVIYFRKKGICTLDQAKKHKNKIINTAMISLITAITGYFLFFYVFLGFIGRVLHIWK